MKIEKIEKIMKSRVDAVNKSRFERIQNGYLEKYNKPVTWQDALGFHYQSRNKIFKDCNGNCTFDPVKLQAYSYKHWMFVDLIKGKVVFNNHSYSQTTSTHQNAIRDLLHNLDIQIDFEIDMSRGLEYFKEDALSELYTRLASYEVVLTRKGVRDQTKNNALESIQEVNSDIKVAKTLGAKITKNEIDLIYASAKTGENRRLATLATERVDRSEERRQSKLLEQTGKVIDLSQFAA
jgi:hypothetical protein